MTKGQRRFLNDLAQGDVMSHRDPNPAGDVLVVHGWASRVDGPISGKFAYIYSITAEGRRELEANDGNGNV